MTADPSRLNYPATPLSAPWRAEQPAPHHTPTPAPHEPANEGNDMTDKTEALRLKILDAWTESEHEDVRAADYVLQGYIIGPLAGVAAQVALREAKNGAIADSIVIPRADLPEVKETEDGLLDVDGRLMSTTLHTAEDDRRQARRLLALADYLDAQEPRPLAVGDRVRVTTIGHSDLAVGDVCTVTDADDATGREVQVVRDGTTAWHFIATVNVERIED